MAEAPYEQPRTTDAQGTMITAQPDWTPQMYATTNAHATQTFFLPEVRRRVEAGVREEITPIRAAQAVFYPGEPTRIRFNHEVRVVLGLVNEQREGDGESKEVLVDIEWFELHEDEAHCGHITSIAMDCRQWGAFDVCYNLPAVREHLAAAREFLDTAARSLEDDQLPACADNLYSAVERTAKAFFLQTPEPRLLKRANHRVLASEINRERKAGKIDLEHASLLNRLGGLRLAGRYLARPLSLTSAELVPVLAEAERLHARVVAESVPASAQPAPVK